MQSSKAPGPQAPHTPPTAALFSPGPDRFYNYLLSGSLSVTYPSLGGQGLVFLKLPTNSDIYLLNELPCLTPPNPDIMLKGSPQNVNFTDKEGG